MEVAEERRAQEDGETLREHDGERRGVVVSTFRTTIRFYRGGGKG
jgi:hypothetical protein